MTRNSHTVITIIAGVIILQTRDSWGFSPTKPIIHNTGLLHKVLRTPSTLATNNNRIVVLDAIPDIIDDEPCLVGDNIVASCDIINDDNDEAIISTGVVGTQTKLSAAINLGKCICGAGSFALPHVFLEEGVLGGTLAMMVCAFLAMNTMQSINRSRYLVSSSQQQPPPTSYVDLTKLALGDAASKLVFTLTLVASLGVSSTYIVFVGQTLASLSADALSGNIVHTLAPDIDETTWEAITAATVFPLSLVRNYGVFAFTSALGVTAVLGGIFVTLAYGVLVDPGGGIGVAFSAVSHLKMWPDSFSDAFGGSFGTIAYLFCINFLTFPILNSMKDAKNDYDGAISSAVAVIWTVNALFAIVCLGFYGDETQDLVLQNLDNGPYLSALKILLCVDLLFTFPVVFSSGRQILENVLIGDGTDKKEGGEDDSASLALSRTAVTGGAVATCFGLSQVGGFGVVANLIGGVAQGTLAFIIPPAIAVALSRRNGDGSFDASEIPQFMIGTFGVAVVSSVTYFTLVEVLS
mmetsp:Transcript_24116/g.50488  ORF Transcript_24116/g.50488 Transcript_24116/m.50488 type:complete len:522 (+) Transcript_24116:151-1716(+)